MTNEVWAFYADVYGVFDYVFQTRRYREIFGASALLDALNRIEATSLLLKRPNAVIISAGGGELRALFADEEDAEVCGQELVNLYQQRTAGAARLAYGIERRQNVESLADTFLRAQFALRRQEVEVVPEDERAPLLPFVKACESCGEQSATVKMEDQHLCPVCAQKRSFGSALMRRMRGDVTASGRRTRLEKEALNYFDELQQRDYGSGLLDIYKTMVDSGLLDSLASDTGSIGEASEEGSRVAFLYTDGNRMGQFFAELDGRMSLAGVTEPLVLPEQLETVISGEDRSYLENLRYASNQVHERTIRSIQRTIADFPEVPVQVAMAGGDDGVMMVPADQAIPFAVHYAEIFESEMKELIDSFPGSSLPTAAVGIVIARSGYPLHQLFSLGYDTMHEGKSLASKTGGSVFSWTILGANDPPRIERLGTRFAGDSKHTETYHLYGGPFDMRQMKIMLATAKKMHTEGFPRNKIKPFLRLLILPPKESRYQWRQWRLHLSKEQNRMIHDFYAEWGVTTKEESPWRASIENSHDWYSPLGDLFQIFSYLGVKKGRG